MEILNKTLMDHFRKHKFELLIKNILYKWLICLFAQNIKDEDGILYRLNKSDNKIVATPYSDVERISFALGNDIDLR